MREQHAKKEGERENPVFSKITGIKTFSFPFFSVFFFLLSFFFANIEKIVFLPQQAHDVRLRHGQQQQAQLGARGQAGAD